MIDTEQLKRCLKCKIEKFVREFYKDKTHKYGVRSCCILCESDANKKRHKEDLALRTYRNIRGRCRNPNNRAYAYYGGKGILLDITISEIRIIAKRDNAELMKQPSIDRINSDGNYTLENCRFIELSENCSLGSKKRGKKANA